MIGTALIVVAIGFIVYFIYGGVEYIIQERSEDRIAYTIMGILAGALVIIFLMEEAIKLIK